MAPRLNSLVRKETCADVARAVDIGAALKIGRSEEKGGGREKTSILGDACESLIAAIYLDGGRCAVQTFYDTHWAPKIEDLKHKPKDAKSALQEWAAKKGYTQPRYDLRERSGPDHRPKIRVTNCILRPLATLRPSPVAFATIYRGRLGGRVGASPLRNSDRKQAPGAEVSPSRTHWTGAVSVVRNCFHGRRTWCRIGRACPSASGSPLWMLTTTILVRVFCLLVRRGGGDTAAPRPDQRPDTGHSGLVVGASAWRRLLQGTRQPAPRRSSHPGEGRRFWRPYRPAYASGDRGRTHRGL